MTTLLVLVSMSTDGQHFTLGSLSLWWQQTVTSIHLKMVSLYKHNASDTTRNTFYGAQYNSEIEFTMNDGPSEVKVFKTIEIEGDTKDFDVIITTDLDSGHIDKSSFEKKEGFHLFYIRRNATDEVNTELLSVQGIGRLLAVSSNTFSVQDVPSEVSIGDILYKSTANSYEKRTISATTTNSITTSASAVTPTVNDYIFAAKAPVAESYGLKGYFANIRLGQIVALRRLNYSL